jgi:hypothetical protein
MRIGRIVQVSDPPTLTRVNPDKIFVSAAVRGKDLLGTFLSVFWPAAHDRRRQDFRLRMECSWVPGFSTTECDLFPVGFAPSVRSPALRFDGDGVRVRPPEDERC